MDRYLVFSFINVSVVMWLAEWLLRRPMRSSAEWAVRIGPGIPMLAALLLDGRSGPPGTTCVLVASDLLLIDTLFFQTDGYRPSWGLRQLLLPLLAAAVCLARSVLGAAGIILPFDPAVFTTLCSALLVAVGAIQGAGGSPQRRREPLQGRADRLSLKSACLPALGLAGTLLLALASGGGRFRSSALSILSLALSFLYIFAYVYTSLTVGRSTLRLPSISSAFKPPESLMAEDQRMDVLFQRVEAYMQRERPYLDDNFTLAGLATEMLTNKGKLSKTINEKSGRNFCQYVNNYRIQYAVSLMKKDHRLRVVELSLMSGFHSVASFNMAFKLFMNDTPSEYMRTLQAMDLHPGKGPD